jgi:hypothetical protein
MSFHRSWTRHVHLCFHKFGQKNHTKTCRVWTWGGIPVIRSTKHGYEASGLGFHKKNDNKSRTNSLCNLPDVLSIAGIHDTALGGLLL